MRWLAVDTSTPVGQVVLAETQGNELRRREQKTYSTVGSSHSTELLPAIDELLQVLGWQVNEIDAYVCGVGPGSFTGIRVGVTTLKTLAHFCGKKIVGVPSLRAQAFQALGTPKDPVVFSWIVGAAKGEIYALMGTTQDWDHFQQVVVTPDEWKKLLHLWVHDHSSAAWWVGGPAAQLIPFDGDASRQIQSKENTTEPLPFGEALLELGQKFWHKAIDPLELLPDYIRPPDAEIKLKSGLLRNQAPTRGGTET